MTDSMTMHTWVTRLAHRSSASSVARVLQARFAPCVLDLLGQPRPQAHMATEAII
jgi:hypothetical protein